MRSWRACAVRHLPLLTLAGGLLACALSADAQAPAPVADTRVRLVLSTQPIDREPGKGKERRPSALRPNVIREVITYVQNDRAEPQTVTVQLLAGGAEVATQKRTVDGTKLTQVPWPLPPAPPVAPVPPVPPAPGVRGPVLAPLTGPVALRLLDAGGRPLGRPVELTIDRPADYLTARLEFIPASGRQANRLIATVTPTDQFQGLPCPVELILDPGRIPGFIPGQRKLGTYAGFVTGEGDGYRPLYLVAEDVRLRPDERNGLVYLRADGYNRAFTFRTTFARAGTRPVPQLLTRESLRLDLPAAADPRSPIRVTLEADNLEQPGEERLLLEVLSRVARNDREPPLEQFSLLSEFRGERSERLTYAPGGPHGGLLFRPEVKDWSTELDLSHSYGPTVLRLRLLGKDNRPRKVLDPETDLEVMEVRKTILLDDTPPHDVRFEGPPRQAFRGRAVVLRASGIDEESGIREVLFFTGRPLPDGKIPPDAPWAAGRRVARDGAIWSGELPLPLGAVNPLEVSVRFTNGVGLSTTERILLETADVPPEKVAPKLASIAGVVSEGTRPQVGLAVELRNGAGKVVATIKTDAAGAFVFKDLPPDSYKVSAVKTADETRGEATVTLAAAEQKTGVQIKLWR
jgi:hypothetical protein